MSGHNPGSVGFPEPTSLYDPSLSESARVVSYRGFHRLDGGKSERVLILDHGDSVTLGFEQAHQLCAWLEQWVEAAGES